ncbi:MAG: MarR family transcriptional regulator [Edaphobacter sp.]|uniref:MarR family winged helix-turn-helix transcriptional regulator n=1 Tax=Edaphobacter sp. TaxID=1934404 RepID=UPI0023A5DA29|nr:MarR family transcriptional regulator [Edaphobacter sp.]MDE1177809.1 MarR family transcriptional regulator [Edaphobacter sp.]
MEEQTTIHAARIWVVLAKSYKAMASFVEQQVAGQGLGLSDFMVLEVLLHKGPSTISAIGEKVLLANASMTSAIDRLEKKGFVTRQASEQDRRIRRIELTAKGKIFITTIYEQHEAAIESLMSELTPAERIALHSSLKKIGLAAAAANEHG